VPVQTRPASGGSACARAAYNACVHRRCPPPRRLPATLALACAALLALAPHPARAQRPQDAVSTPSVTLAPATATVGDRLTLTITVEHRADVTVAGPGFGGDYGGLDLVQVAPPADAAAPAGRVRTTLVYTLAAFKTGGFTVPPLTVSYTTADGRVGSVSTGQASVTVRTVLAEGDTDLRPLKPQLGIDAAAPSPVAPVLFVAVFVALTAAGYVLHRRIAATRPPPLAAEAPAPAPPADAAARQALDALASSGFATRDPVEYYARIAATVRAYLSERFDFAAYAMTRRELERGATAAGVDRWPARLTANLLEQCDAVQFAGFVPAPERREADLTAAYEIIELTTGVQPAGSAPEAAEAGS